jgi:hypothetical protein
MLGIAIFQRGDNVPDIDPTPQHVVLVALLRFDPGRDAALSGSRFGGVARFGISARNGKLPFGTARADIAGLYLDQPVEYGVTGKAKNVIDAVVLAPAQ